MKSTINKKLGRWSVILLIRLLLLKLFSKRLVKILSTILSLILSFLLVQLCMVEENVNALYLETPTR